MAVPARDERSLGELFAELSRETGTLIRKEVELATTEMTEKAKVAGTQVGMVAAGGALVHAGLLVFLAAFVVGLAQLGVTPWLAATIVGVLTAGAGYLLVNKGLSALRQTSVAPTQAIEAMKETATWTTRQKNIEAERTAGRSNEYISGRETDSTPESFERATSRAPRRRATGSQSGEPSLDVPMEVRTREIRAEIDETRGALTETVNAIQDRLRPGNLAADAAESVKNTVKHAAGDQARMVADTARDIADSEPVQYVRANPIPAAMVGIGVAGLAWLAFGGREARPRYRSAGRASGDWRRQGPYDEADRHYRQTAGRSYSRIESDAVPSAFGDAGFGEAGYPGQGGYESAAAYSPDLYQGVNRFERVGSRGTSWADNAADDVSRSAADLGRRAQETGREAQQTLQRAWQQNPLVMGAASAVFGLMVGMAVPQTDVENEYMGEARDQAIDGVQQTVRETVTKVQDAATSAVGKLTADAPQAGSAPAAVRNQEQKPAGIGQPGSKPTAV